MTLNINTVQLVKDMALRVKNASKVLALASDKQKSDALRFSAQTLRTNMPALLTANKKDLDYGVEKGLLDAMLDRLMLDPMRIESIVNALESVAEIKDPVGDVMADWHQPNGLNISRVRVPLGVIGIIYESRPNVTADAGGLCIKSGNGALLRGGSDSLHSSNIIAEAIRDGLVQAGLPADCVALIPTTDRDAVGAMLTSPEVLDVIIPRGGASLVARVMDESKVPVFAHLQGINHTYVHHSADVQMAVAVVANAKMRRTGICGATETLLIDKELLRTTLPQILFSLRKEGCEIIGDEKVCQMDDKATLATQEDWSAEYLAPKISVKVVGGIREAIEHINTYGSHHTDAIVAENADVVQQFLNEVDSAIVMHNTSTQFADGGEFGMGAEIGIATGRIHARGPVGVEQLTTFKYLVKGTGQCRKK